MNGYPDAEQAVPVLEMRPKELKVAQPAVPPALETTRPVVEAVVTDREVVVAFVPVAFVKVRPCRDEATLVDVAVKMFAV